MERTLSWEKVVPFPNELCDLGPYVKHALGLLQGLQKTTLTQSLHIAGVQEIQAHSRPQLNASPPWASVSQSVQWLRHVPAGLMTRFLSGREWQRVLAVGSLLAPCQRALLCRLLSS